MSKALKFPTWLLILDALGTIVFGLGLYGQFRDDNLFAPFAIPMIIAGALLMVPLLIFLVMRATNRG